MDEKLRDMLAAGQRQKVKEELRRLLSDCNLWYMTTNSGDENSYESKKARKAYSLRDGIFRVRSRFGTNVFEKD